MLIQSRHYLRIGAELGEGPAWFDNALWFVDIKGRRIFRHIPATGSTDRWESPEMVGWILPASEKSLIVGFASGLYRFDTETATFAEIERVDAKFETNRLNDAAVDRHGRLYFGTMDNLERNASGSLYRFDQGRLARTSIPPCIITNGPAISPDGCFLYHVDTLDRRVVRCTIADDGAVEGGETFLHFTVAQGHPDGAICDSEGGLWIGFYGGWAARRYSPDGQLTDEVAFPVANVTKIALGGPERRTAFATTARQGLDAQALAQQPLAGDIFTFEVSVPGLPQNSVNS